MISAIWGGKCLQYYRYSTSVGSPQISNINSRITTHNNYTMHTFRLQWYSLTLKQVKQITHLLNITIITGITADVNLSLITDENILNEKRFKLFDGSKANG